VLRSLTARPATATVRAKGATDSDLAAAAAALAAARLAALGAEGGR
jgi:thiamine pyrophosphokinase